MKSTLLAGLRPRALAAAVAGFALAFGALQVAQSETAGNASYVYGWSDVRCTHIGGNNGLGGWGIDMFIKENDFSGTNYFRLIVRVERFLNGSWRGGESFSFRRPSNSNFPNDSRDFQTTVEFFGSFEQEDRGIPTRFKATWQWWDSRSGPDFRLAQAVKRFRCDPPA